jgi:hypothetical protein
MMFYMDRVQMYVFKCVFEYLTSAIIDIITGHRAGHRQPKSTRRKAISLNEFEDATSPPTR